VGAQLIANAAAAIRMMTVLDRKDWPLAALGCAADGKLTPIQMQKTLFLIKMEAGQWLHGEFYDFVPYNYGPFDSTIYKDIAQQEAEQNIVTERAGNRWDAYFITVDGKRKATELLNGMDPDLRNFLGVVVNWVKERGFSELLQSIYQKYPAYAVNSVFNK
jgi:hypothetical protein